MVGVESNWQFVEERVVNNWAIVGVVVPGKTFVEAMIANNYETVAVMVASSLLELLASLDLAFVVAVKAASNSTVFAASAVDVSTLLVVEETVANNWSTVVAMSENTGYFVAMAQRT